SAASMPASNHPRASASRPNSDRSCPAIRYTGTYLASFSRSSVKVRSASSLLPRLRYSIASAYRVKASAAPPATIFSRTPSRLLMGGSLEAQVVGAHFARTEPGEVRDDRRGNAAFDRADDTLAESLVEDLGAGLHRYAELAPVRVVEGVVVDDALSGLERRG